MPRAPTLIRHPDDLDRLSLIPGIRSPGAGRIWLADADGLDPALGESYQRRLNRLYFACGCDRAALGLAGATLGYGAWLAAGYAQGRAFGWGDLWVGLAVVVAATFVGKLIGLSLKNRELKATIAELKRAWKAPPRPAGAASACG